MPYTPTEWGSKNPKLTPELMNHLENGIAELESSTNASVTELTEENTQQNGKITALENSFSELQSSTNASVTELTEENTRQNNNITALNSKLSKQLGSHTVKSDVPENAVFTDTVYDDTEVKESIDELNSNLDALEYSEIAGGKNLANINDFKTLTSNTSRYGYEWLNMKGGTYTFNITNGNNRLYIGYKHNGKFVNPSNVKDDSKVQTITINDGDDIVIWYDEGVTENTVTKLQLEVGSVATNYEPYIPSVKMLAEEVSAQNESLETLGKCKNLLNPTLQTTTAKGVTCTSNGDGTYTLNGTSTYADEWEFKVGIAAVEKGKRYKIIGFKNPTTAAKLKADTSNKYEDGQQIYNASANIENVYIKFNNGVTFNNEIIKPMITPNLNATYDDFVPYTGDGDTLTSDVAKVNSDLSRVKKSVGEVIASRIYAPPESIETTQDGVTFTENTDGKITLTGIATKDTVYQITNGYMRQAKWGNPKYKLICCPPEGSESTFWVSLEKGTSGEKFYDYGDGVEITPLAYSQERWKISIHIKSGYDTSKLPGAFTPLLTPDLKSSYSDEFVCIGPKPTIMQNIKDLSDSVDEDYDELQYRLDDLGSSVDAQINSLSDITVKTGRKKSTVDGMYSTAVNYDTTASGYASHAEGRETVASGEYSHAEGHTTTASGVKSHAEGTSTTSSGLSSHAENCLTKATGNYSHAGGYNTEASGEMSYTEGGDTKATAPCSHAEGRGTIASGWEQHVQGKYNEADTSGKYAHIIGGGTDDSNRKNIHTVDWEGNAEYAGNITSTDSSGNKTSLNDLITGIDLKNTSGHVTKVHVDFLNVGGQKIVLQGSVSGAAGDFFSVSKNDNVGFDLKVDNTFVVPEPVTKLLYSSQGDFRSTVVGTITITHGTWSDGTKSISVNIVFNNNYNFTSAAVRSGIVYFDF